MPWALNATLRVPLQQGAAVTAVPSGAGTLIVGRAKIFAFFKPVLPYLGKVEVLRQSIAENWICISAKVRLAAGPPVPILVSDCFRIENERIAEHRIYLEPQQWW